MITRDYDEDFHGDWIYWIQVGRVRIHISYRLWDLLRWIPRKEY